MSTTRIKISDELYEDLKKASQLSNRTVEEQLDRWVRLGLIINKTLTTDEINLLKQAKPGELNIKVIKVGDNDV